jgi:hypothetical protein
LDRGEDGDKGLRVVKMKGCADDGETGNDTLDSVEVTSQTRLQCFDEDGRKWRIPKDGQIQPFQEDWIEKRLAIKE